MSENESDLVSAFRDLDWGSALDIALIVAGAWILTYAARGGIAWIADRVRGSLRIKILPWIPVVRFLILLSAIGLVIPVLIRPTLESMVAISAALALAVGFAFKDYFSGVIAGVVAIVERPYRLGDWVKIDGAYGEVTSVGVRSVTIVTPDDTEVFIPHSKLWTTNIFNSNAGRHDLMCVADFFLHPDHDAAAVRQHLADVATSSPYVNLDRPIAVILADEPWGTHYRLKAYPIDARYQFEFISDLTVRAKAVFRRLGATPVTVPAAKNYSPEARSV